MAVTLGGLALAGGIAATASHVNSFLSNRYNEKNRAAQIAADKELMDYQNSINRQYLMDSPSMTVEGLRKAGLSPLSAQGSFTQSGNSSIANVGTPTGEVPKFNLDPMTLSQLEVNQSQSDANKALAKVYEADATGKNIDNETKGDINEATLQQIYSNIGLNTAKVDEINSTISVNQSKIDNLVSDTAKNDALVERMQTQNFLDTWEMYLKTDKCKAEIDKLVADTGLSKAQAYDIYQKLQSGYWQSVVSLNSAGAADAASHVSVNNSQAAVNGSLVGFYNASTRKVDCERFGQQIANYIADKTAKSTVSATNNKNYINGSKFVLQMDKAMQWSNGATSSFRDWMIGVNQGVKSAMPLVGGMSGASEVLP